MFKNYFKVALRNILKHKFYSILNIAGLAFGLTVCTLIGMYIFDEVSFDTFHREPEKIYRVALLGKIGGQEVNVNSTCPPLAAAMVREIPGVEHAIRLQTGGDIVMKYEDKAFTEKDVISADSNFFDFFNFKLLEGDPKEALKDPNTVVLSRKAAVRYFGEQQAMGKIITVGNDNKAFKVTGVVEDEPDNTHIRFDILLSAESDDNMKQGIWLNNGLYTYFRKNSKTSLESIDSKLRELVVKYAGPELEKAIGVNFKQFESQGGKYGYYAYPLLDTHLYSGERRDDISPPSDIKYVYIIGAVGLFILLIASINFMNLSTARSAGRAKEVGLRKTLGSHRSTLIAQFLSESIIYSLLGLIVAILAVYLLLPSFNLLAGKHLVFGLIFQPVILLSIVAIFLMVALLAGSYPAFYLTSFNPVEVLKGKVKSGMKSKGIRSALVVVQFSISITLIISTMIVFNQLNYLQEKNIGMDKQNVIILSNTRRLGNNMDAFKEEVGKITGIVKASYTTNVFPGVNNTTVFREAGTEQDRMMGTYSADYDHLSVLHIELAQGRFFSKDFPSDSNACVINEAALKEIGWNDPLSQKLTAFFGPKPIDMNVIGVVKDFNFESFKSKVRPLVIKLTGKSNAMLVRYEGSSREQVAKVEAAWKKSAPNEPFEYTFMDQSFDKLFHEEQRLSQLFTVMTGIAIFVACLGLLGLASFTAEQRTKEIGVRKVMGASVSGISTLLSKEFMTLVGISFVIASALAWYAMNQWLSTFAYRIDMGVSVFLLGGFLSAAIAWLTVSFHFIKAARSNPVISLRYE